MEKIFKGIKKNYKIINIVILCIYLYLLVFLPIVSSLLEKISPNLTKCPYLQLTGKPCPLCGGTRFLANIKNVFNDISYIFNFFGIIILFFIFEIIYRVIILRKKEVSDITIKNDIIIHTIFIIFYFLYSIYFILSE